MSTPPPEAYEGALGWWAVTLEIERWERHLANKAALGGEVGFLVLGDRCDRCGDTNYDDW